MEFDKYSHMISFEGHFWEGLRHGVGTEMWSNGTMMYKGEYSRGLRQGRGIEYDWEGTFFPRSNLFLFFKKGNKGFEGKWDKGGKKQKTVLFNFLPGDSPS